MASSRSRGSAASRHHSVGGGLRLPYQIAPTKPTATKIQIACAPQPKSITSPNQGGKDCNREQQKNSGNKYIANDESEPCRPVLRIGIQRQLIEFDHGTPSFVSAPTLPLYCPKFHKRTVLIRTVPVQGTFREKRTEK